jgi:hypothetical protein
MSYSPIVKVEHDDAGDSFAAAVDIGEIKDDSTHEPSLYEDERNTRGELLYAGETNLYNISCYDDSKRAALLADWKAGTRKDFRLTRADGTTIEVLDCLPNVGPIVNAMVAGQKTMFRLQIYKHVD